MAALSTNASRKDGGPLESLVVPILIAAVKVMQLVAERDGASARSLDDALFPLPGASPPRGGRW